MTSSIGKVRFICDEMLARMGRWLRIMGHDVLLPKGLPDRDLIKLSITTGRVLLTRDKDLANSKGADPIMIKSDVLEGQLKEFIERFPVRTYPPGGSRCPECNGVLRGAHAQDLERPEVKEKLPPSFRGSHGNKLFICSECSKLYWEGSHWERILERFSRLSYIPFVGP